MMTRQLCYQFTLAFIILQSAILSPSTAQDTNKINYKGNQDPTKALTSGTLPNGFKYYILPHGSTSEKIHLQFVCRVGEYNEALSEVQLSHLIEHLAFQGTELFKNPFTHFESKGLRLGEEVTGETGSVATRYQLIIPENNDELFNDAITFFSDLSHRITISESNLEKQKTIVFDELNMRRSYASRMMNAYQSEIAKGTKWATRYAFDERKNILDYTTSDVSKYYNKWYQPNRQCIIVVGPVDVQKAEALIKEKFISIKNKTLPKESDIKGENLHMRNHFIVVRDKEKQNWQLDVWRYLTTNTSKRSDNPTQVIEERLLSTLLTSRMDSLSRQTQFRQTRYAAYIEHKSLTNQPASALVLKVFSQEDSLKGPIQESALEMEAIKKFSFTQQEVIEAKQTLKQEIFDETLGASTSILVNNLTQVFIDNGILKNKDSEYQELITALDALTTETLGSMFRMYYQSKNSESVVLQVPHHCVTPSSTQFVNWINSSILNEQKPQNKKQFPILIKPTYSKIKTNHTAIPITEIQATDISLDNGMRVLLKPLITKDPKSEIVFINIFAPIGYRDIHDSLKSAAIYAPLIILQNGLSNLDASQFRHYLARKGISINIAVEYDVSRIHITTSRQNLQEALQIIKMYIEDPQNNKTSFKSILTDIYGNISRAPGDLENIVLDSIQATYSIDPQHKKVHSPDEIQKIKYKDIIPAFKQIFSRTSEFTCIITGSFNTNTIIEEVSQTMGSFPKSVKISKLSTPSKRKQQNSPDTVIISDPVQVNEMCRIIINKELSIDIKTKTELNILTSVIQGRLRERLTMQEGKTYVVFATNNFKDGVNSSFSITIYFQASPKNVNYTLAAITEELQRIRTTTFDSENLSHIIVNELQNIKNDLSNPYFWGQYLQEQIMNSKDLREISSIFDQIHNNDTVSIQRLCETYVKDATYRCYIYGAPIRMN